MPPTAEEAQLFADAGTSECIQVFVPVHNKPNKRAISAAVCSSARTGPR